MSRRSRLAALERKVGPRKVPSEPVILPPLEAFVKLPEDEQDRILLNWRPPEPETKVIYPSKEELRKMSDEEFNRLYAEIMGMGKPSPTEPYIGSLSEQRQLALLKQILRKG